MTTPCRFSVIVMCFLTLSTGLGRAQDNVDQVLNEIDRLKAQFVRDKAAEKRKVLNQFDMVIRRVTNNTKLPAADRLATADQLKADRDSFAKYDSLPGNSDVASYGWNYGIALVKKHAPLSKAYDKAMSIYLKNDNPTQAKLLKGEKDKFDDTHLPGRHYLVPGAYYVGSRYGGGGAVPYSFRVNQLNGSVLKARLEDNLQFAGHSIVDATASLDGIHIIGGPVTAVQGGNPKNLRKWEGVAVGKTLIVAFTNVNAKGQGGTSFAVLQRK